MFEFNKDESIYESSKANDKNTVPDGPFYLDVCPPFYRSFHDPLRRFPKPEISKVEEYSKRTVVQLGRGASPKTLWLAATEQGQSPDNVMLHIKE